MLKMSNNYHGNSSFYHKDKNIPVLALLGQPNSGKSTIFNMMTGSLNILETGLEKQSIKKKENQNIKIKK